MRKSILFTVLLMAAVLISACSDSGDYNKTPPPTQTYDITGKIDYAGKTISSAKVCLDVNNDGLANDTDCMNTTDGGYNFTSTNNPDYYPLVAYIKEETNTAVNAKIMVDNNEYDSILYAPKGKTDTISITTTLAKSLMDKDSALSLNNAETQAEEIVIKAESPATVLTVYNNALNSANITDISTSIRGLVNVITDKLNKETNITDNTNITVSQEEVNTANDEISKADEEHPQEPQEPENPSGEPATPLEKVTEMLAGAEIKNAENPVNLNDYVDTSHTSKTQIAFKDNAFGDFSSNTLMTGTQLLAHLNYKEEGWPSDNSLKFEVFPSYSGGYAMANYTSKIGIEEKPTSDNVCNANGKINGIYYKSLFDESLYRKNATGSTALL